MGEVKCAFIATLCLLLAAAAMGADILSATPTMQEQVRMILSGNLTLEASQQAAVKQLVAVGEPAGIAMAKYLPTKVTTVTITLRDAYVEMKEKASPGLRLGLASENTMTRRVAMSFLSEIGSATDRDVFLAYLDDDDESLRTLAARGLVGAATLGDTRAELALLEVLDATLPALRKWAVLALGTWGSARALEPLATRLSDESWTVRWDAARGLAELAKRGHGAFVRAQLEPLLNSDHARTRALAAWALGQGGVADAALALRTRARREADPISLGYQLEALRILEKKPVETATLPESVREHPFVHWKAR